MPEDGRMARREIHPFTDEHVPDAGGLLAARHRRHRLDRPELAPGFEDPVLAEKQIAEAWTVADASGAVATEGGSVVGFLLGAPKTNAMWGPNLWVESAGQALGDGVDAELVRDLYAAAATRWVDEGRTAHYVLLPAADAPLVDAWFRLGFGHQQAHAVRSPLPAYPDLPAGLTVRRAERRDIPALAELDVTLPRHQGLAPCFSAGQLGSVEEAVAEWEEDFDDPDFATFVAEHDDRVVGSAVGCALTKSGSNSGLVRPDNAGFLGFAAVLPSARGLGAGRALGETVLAWSNESGFDVVATDWRVTNLLSSRAWTALGFAPTFFRLHRTIGY
jgi:ribosomal protein S18 acetylase RimI-like enzyme